VKSGSVPCGIAVPQDFWNRPASLELARDFVRRAEALPFDSLWVQEQIIGDMPLLEPVTLLGYLAALTSRVRLGTSVLVTSLRNPVQLAKSLSSLDHLCGGRLTVAGEYWQLREAAMEPKPVQKPHPPLWFGARQPPALRRAVEHGDGWMGGGSASTADFARHCGLVRQCLEEAGRDPASFVISKRVYVALDDDRDRAERRLRDWVGFRYKNPDLASRVAVWGGRQECVDRLADIVKAGARHLLLHPVFDELEHLERLAAEVVPQL
jgi:alkanesulfonate monooxygenase SsuD/methylene tetrahydromethanopterin reductase-like flavin-dependent oxidoreductase (luciferase family)